MDKLKEWTFNLVSLRNHIFFVFPNLLDSITSITHFERNAEAFLGALASFSCASFEMAKYRHLLKWILRTPIRWIAKMWSRKNMLISAMANISIKISRCIGCGIMVPWLITHRFILKGDLGILDLTSDFSWRITQLKTSCYKIPTKTNTQRPKLTNETGVTTHQKTQ